MANLTRSTVTMLAATFVALSTNAAAQTATEADFDACNRVAQAASARGTLGSSGSAGAPGPIGSSSVSGGADPTTPPTFDANRQINSSGRISSSAGSPGTNSGTTSSSGATGSPSASPRTSATDMHLTGMAATGHGNAAYQQAYRDCMKQRGF
jgi:hypothetical protein